MTVHELKAWLADKPDHARVGVLDHFGVLQEIDIHDVRYHQENSHWRNQHAFVELPAVDLGKEPE